jgi:hypothetical protein
VEDACGFAWLQLVRCKPDRERAFAWLCATAIREEVKLDRRGRRVVELDRQEDQPASDGRLELERREELLAAGQAFVAARLTARECRLVVLRALGYSRRQMSLATGESLRAIDRQLGRAPRKLSAAWDPGREASRARRVLRPKRHAATDQHIRERATRRGIL